MRLCGTVQTSIANLGSKSEKLAYFIVRPDGNHFRIYKEGDNPFTNPSLLPFDGTEVEILGDFDGDLFVVKDIQKLVRTSTR